MISTKRFGRTENLSSRVLFGGVALAEASQSEADAALDVLLQYGINHIDTAAGYGDSELRIGPWMDRHRKDFFLATKTDRRSYGAALEQIQRSLDRLRVDRVDLLQLHNLTDMVDWEVAMGPGGALEAVVEARSRGWTRFIGVTGHGLSAPRMHKRSLEFFDFDSVLLPDNYLLLQNPQYAQDLISLLQLCRHRDVPVATIKAIARGLWGNAGRTAINWYRPLDDQPSIDRCVHWVMGQPDVFLVSCGDLGALPKYLLAAARFENAPTDAEMVETVIAAGIEPIFI